MLCVSRGPPNFEQGPQSRPDRGPGFVTNRPETNENDAWPRRRPGAGCGGDPAHGGRGCRRAVQAQPRAGAECRSALGSLQRCRTHGTLGGCGAHHGALQDAQNGSLEAAQCAVVGGVGGASSRRRAASNGPRAGRENTWPRNSRWLEISGPDLRPGQGSLGALGAVGRMFESSHPDHLTS